MADLQNIPTRELVEELSRREGVDAQEIDPYQSKSIQVEGPAIALVVTD